MSAYPRTAQEGTFLKPEHIRVPIPPPNAHLDSDCRGVASILARVGDKWSVFVIMLLGNGPRRFNEIKRMVGGISQRMLTLTLRGLERDGLVTRTIFPTIPPRVDYELTELGRGLSRPVIALGEWAKKHQDEIESARSHFDEKDAAKYLYRSDTSPPPCRSSRPASSSSSSTVRTTAGEASAKRIRSSSEIGVGPSRAMMRARSLATGSSANGSSSSSRSS